MSKEEAPNEISLAIFDGAISLTENEMFLLGALAEHPSWPVMRSLLKSMDDSMTVALRDKEATMETIRYHQGISATVQRLAEIVEVDVPEWYDSRPEEEAEGEGTTKES